MGCAVQKGLTDVHKMFLVCCIFCRLDSARSSGVNCVVSNALRRPSDELDHRHDQKSSACGQELTPEETSLDFFVPTRAPTWLTKLNFKPVRPMCELTFGFQKNVREDLNSVRQACAEFWKGGCNMLGLRWEGGAKRL